MGAGCVIVIWLAIALLAGGVWLGCLLAFLFGRAKNSRVITWVSGIPLVAITAGAVALIALLGFGMIRATNPRYVYQDTFRERPSADVRHLRSKGWSFADTAHVFMRFEASPETFHRILPAKMQKVSYPEYKRRMPGNNVEPPSWWSPPTEATSEIYIWVPDYGDGESFAAETTLMSYDAQTHTVTYFYLGID